MSKTKPAPVAATNGEAIAAPPSEFEFRTVTIQTAPQKTLEIYARAGWELVGVTNSGFDHYGFWCAVATSLYFRRRRGSLGRRDSPGKQV